MAGAEEETGEVNAEGTRDIEQAIRLIGIEEKHSAGVVAAITQLGLSQHGRVRVNFQIVAGITSGWQTDRTVYGSCRVQRLLNDLGIRRLSVALCSEVSHVEKGTSPRPTPFGCLRGYSPCEARYPQKSGSS